MPSPASTSQSLPDPWQEPVRGGYPDPALLSLPGREQLARLLSGQTPRPPISRLTGMRLIETGESTATFELPLTDWLRSPSGAISIGPLVMPADAAMACAIQTVLPPHTPFSTSELTLRLLTSAPIGQVVRAQGRVVQVGQSLALAEGSVCDENEQLIAHGSTLCMLQRNASLPGLGQATPASAPSEPAPDPADPWQRPARGEILAPDIWEQRSGLEILRAQLSGQLPQPPIHHLLGVTLRAVDPGTAEVQLPATEWLCAPARLRVQGGAVATLAESALVSAIQTTLPAGTTLDPIDLKVNYLRPLNADGRIASGVGVIVYGGRRLAVANATVNDADGRQVAVATGSAMIRSGPAGTGEATGS